MNRLCTSELWFVSIVWCISFIHLFIHSASQPVSYSTILSSVVSLSLSHSPRIHVWYIFFYCLFSYFSYVCVWCVRIKTEYTVLWSIYKAFALLFLYTKNTHTHTQWQRERAIEIEKYYTSYVYALFDTKSIWNKYKWIKTLFLCCLSPALAVCVCVCEYYFWWTIDNENCVELRTMHSLISIAFIIIMLCVYQLGRIFHWKAMTMNMPATMTTTLKLLFAPSLSLYSTFESKLSLWWRVSCSLSRNPHTWNSLSLSCVRCVRYVCDECEPCLLMRLAGWLAACLLLPLKLNGMR